MVFQFRWYMIWEAEGLRPFFRDGRLYLLWKWIFSVFCFYLCKIEKYHLIYESNTTDHLLSACLFAVFA